MSVNSGHLVDEKSDLTPDYLNEIPAKNVLPSALLHPSPEPVAGCSRF